MKIPGDLISKAMDAHAATVKAAMNWAAAAANGGSVRTRFDKYEKAEARFDAAMSRVIEAAKR